MNKSCLICEKHLHNSNKKTQCSICLQFAHMCCVNTDADTFFCVNCLKNCLPCIDDVFMDQSDKAIYELKMNISTLCNHKLNLNPFESLDEKFIDNVDIDADRNFLQYRK